MAKEVAGAERIYTIPLRREWLKQTRIQRSNRAIHAIQNFLTRHLKATEVKISPRLNELVWKRGAEKPPAKVRVKASKDAEGVVTARLPEEMVIKEEPKTGKLEGLKEKVAGKAEKPAEISPEAEEKPKPKEVPKTEEGPKPEEKAQKEEKK